MYPIDISSTVPDVLGYSAMYQKAICINKFCSNMWFTEHFSFKSIIVYNVLFDLCITTQLVKNVTSKLRVLICA